jgi:tRNA(fMet)-specific endonuclease VapC
MISSPALLDTDILSALLKGRSTVVAQAQSYLRIHSKFSFSIITQYEVLRGLNAKGATVQIQAFQRFCRINEIVPLDDAIVQRAAEIYSRLHQGGTLIGDADILIAATAMERGFTVMTNNVRHFQRIPGLTIEN